MRNYEIQKRRIYTDSWEFDRISEETIKGFKHMDLEDVIVDIMRYFGLGYAFGQLFTKEAVEKIHKTMKENTGIK